MQGAGVWLFEVLMIAVLRLLARSSPWRGAVFGVVLGAVASTLYLGTLGDHETRSALGSMFLILGTSGLCASIGMRLPSLLQSHLRRCELSGILGPTWDKLTRDLMKITGREDLAEDPRRQRLIEAYADAFEDLPTSPDHAKARMAEAISLSEDLLESNGPRVDEARGKGVPEDRRSR